MGLVNPLALVCARTCISTYLLLCLSIVELESEGLSSGEDSLLGDGGGEVNATEEEMEKLLLENMSSSAEEEEGEEFMQKPAKKRRKRCVVLRHLSIIP